MKHELLSGDGNYATTYSEEDGKKFVGNHHDLNPIIKRVQHIRDMHSQATKQSNPNEWKHVGTVPIVIITDWCRRNGYTFDQWARDDDNAKQKFCKYFFSREFSKLHNQHVTTKSESSQILMPEKFGDKR